MSVSYTHLDVYKRQGFIKSIQPNSHTDWLDIGRFAVIYILPSVKVVVTLAWSVLPLFIFLCFLVHKTSRNNCILYSSHNTHTHKHISII